MDDKDDDEDGLRIVMGHLDRPRPDVCASFVAGGTRFLLDSEQVLAEFSVPRPPPKEWLRRVSCREDESETYERELG